MSSSNAPVRSPRVKGSGIVGFFSWWDVHGEPTLETLVAGLPPEHRRHFETDRHGLALLPSTWYPAEAIHAVLDALMDGRSEAERHRISREGTHHALREQLGGIYKFLFQAIMNPTRYARMSQKIFGRYFSDGVMTKTQDGPTCQTTHLRDWGGHHPFLCDITMFGAEIVYELLGCRGVEVRRRSCVSDGDDECCWATTWQA